MQHGFDNLRPRLLRALAIGSGSLGLHCGVTTRQIRKRHTAEEMFSTR
jgi:hypothetical protein